MVRDARAEAFGHKLLADLPQHDLVDGWETGLVRSLTRQQFGSLLRAIRYRLPGSPRSTVGGGVWRQRGTGTPRPAVRLPA